MGRGRDPSTTFRAPEGNWVCLYNTPRSAFRRPRPTRHRRELGLFRTMAPGPPAGTKAMQPRNTPNTRKGLPTYLLFSRGSRISRSSSSLLRGSQSTGGLAKSRSFAQHLVAATTPGSRTLSYSRRLSTPVCCTKTKKHAEISKAEPAPAPAAAGGGRPQAVGTADADTLGTGN